jgi:hypothetical protein
MATSVASPLVSCLHLCDGIWSQLSTAKHNEKECVSLKALASSIRNFVKPLEYDDLSDAGKHAVGEMGNGVMVRGRVKYQATTRQG